jgi:hypothetical protein
MLSVKHIVTGIVQGTSLTTMFAACYAGFMLLLPWEWEFWAGVVGFVVLMPVAMALDWIAYFRRRGGRDA